MPSYNHSEYLRPAIESVLNQDYPDFELIIIDDGSSDVSPDIIKEYSQKDRRVRAIFHEKNMGISRTANDGIEASYGRYIALMASDDVWKPNKLRVQMELFEYCPDSVQWAETGVIDESGKRIDTTYTRMYRAGKATKSGDIFNELLKVGNFLSGQTIILRKDLLGGVRFDESLKYLGDFKFELELAAVYNFLFHQEPLADYRIHGNNSIQSDKQSWDRDWLNLSDFLLGQYAAKIGGAQKSAIYWERGRSLLRLSYRVRSIRAFTKAFLLCPQILIFKAWNAISSPFRKRDGEGIPPASLESEAGKKHGLNKFH